jgi:hypothetical protein
VHAVCVYMCVCGMCVCDVNVSMCMCACGVYVCMGSMCACVCGVWVCIGCRMILTPLPSKIFIKFLKPDHFRNCG